VVAISAPEIDALGLEVCNIRALRQAVARLELRPDYVLSDGFPVPGLSSPGLGVWKGDAVAASVAAASIVAKVTRDRIMRDMHEKHPEYSFCDHKGYVTQSHMRALQHHGPCEAHRYSYAPVRRVVAGRGVGREGERA
jgi:ribonuclease HII